MGNSRVALSISMAFAASLVGPCDEESGGIHLWNKSSVGKTTSVKVSGSVWGGGDHGYYRAWRATTNGLESVAACHNDTLLCLDELSQVDPKEADRDRIYYEKDPNLDDIEAAKSECPGDPGHYRMAGGPILIMEGYYIR